MSRKNPPKSAPDAAPHAATRADRFERRFVISIIAFTLFVASLPYLLAYAIVPAGYSFIGTAYNIDDYCNYLSWLRQTADGHFFLRNLFTTEPQKGLEFNLLFWLLGQIVRFAHISPQAALQIARVVGGGVLLSLIARFYRLCLPGFRSARMLAFVLTCLGSGFGWLGSFDIHHGIHWHGPLYWRDKNEPNSPVDAWQPEAFTFLSVYTSALFTVSTCFILGAIYLLIRGEQTGSYKYAAGAGLCGAVLGNIHSYDVLHIAAAWGLFLLVRTAVERGAGVAGSWKRAILALVILLPTTLYQYYVFRSEAVFHERAEVATLSPPFVDYILGYGVAFLLAAVGLCWVARRLAAQLQVRTPLLAAACWAIAGLAVIYIPLAFQRKMLMGEHIPLCLLAGLGAWVLVKKENRTRRIIAFALVVLLAIPSNVLFLARDFRHLEYNESETAELPFVSDTFTDMCAWLRANTPENAAVVGFPTLCTKVPGYTDRAVWAGHWGETPHYGDHVRLFMDFADAQTADAARRAFLASTGASYLFYPNDVSALSFHIKRGVLPRFVDFSANTPDYLQPVYSNKDYSVYRIVL